ncbi:MAG: hypothetical protein Fur0041_22680 [Bacteroidia bacterium]
MLYLPQINRPLIVKNINTILNVVLLGAVITLFVLHFSGNKSENDTAKKAADSTPQLKFELPKNLNGAKVLYINVDSLDLKYEAFADLSKETGVNYKAKMLQYQNKGAELQQRYGLLQEKVQMGTISADEAAKEEKAINEGMEELKKMETELAFLENNAFKKNATITQEITKYFKKYSQDKGIDFILGYGASSTVLYANDSLDITNAVVEALNAEYRASKAAKKK